MKKIFCLNKKNFSINNNDGFLSSYVNHVELPIENHPGSFGYKRKNHNHEGLDFYCENNDEVFAIEDGLIIKIKVFTGESVGSPWWCETEMILVKHNDFCFNYGEIAVNKKLNIGDTIRAGDYLGNVKTVLKKDKGRPMNMLHLEMYNKETIDSIPIWSIEKEKPSNLLDPTDYFLKNFF